MSRYATVSDVEQHATCANCNQQFAPARSDARTCSTRCRVALHRAEKARLERLQAIEDEKHRQYVAVTQHRERWVTYLTNQVQPNSRPTKEKMTALYEAMLRDGMIDAPWQQRRLY